MSKIRLPKSNLSKYLNIEIETKEEIATLETALAQKKDELLKLQKLIEAHKGFEPELPEMDLTGKK